MATINLGAIKFNWKGAYNSSTSYAVDDVVSSGGNSYVCIQAHSTAQAVGNATAYWNIMSSAGTNGTNGTDISTTLTTQGDILYRDGSGLARLGYGTAGQVLQTGGSGANPSWTTVSSKLLGQSHSYDHTRSDKGNRYRNKITLMSHTHPVINTNSYFMVHAKIHLDNQHHCRAGLEVSTDNSSWSYFLSNGVTPNGAGLGWSSNNEYKYPHMGFQYSGDNNTASSGTVTLKYAPSTPHGLSNIYFRAYGYSSNSSNNLIFNGTDSNSSADGSVYGSSIEVIEYKV